MPKCRQTFQSTSHGTPPRRLLKIDGTKVTIMNWRKSAICRAWRAAQGGRRPDLFGCIHGRMSSFVSLLSARVQRNRSGSVVIFRIYVSSFDLAISAIHTIRLYYYVVSRTTRCAETRDIRRDSAIHPTAHELKTGHSARLYTVTARHHTRQPPSSLRSETGQSHAHYTCRRCTVEILSRTRYTKSRRDPSRSLTACMPPSGAYWGSLRGAQGELSLEPTHAIVHELILSLSLRSQSPINPSGSPQSLRGRLHRLQRRLQRRPRRSRGYPVGLSH
jgi:hypothetical protein